MLNHIALQVDNKDKAIKFYQDILGIPKAREFTVSAGLGKSIFGIQKEINAVLFSNKDVTFEIFVADEKPNPSFIHTCLTVPNREELMKRCEAHGIRPNIVIKGDRELLFIRDFAGNLFEIK